MLYSRTYNLSVLPALKVGNQISPGLCNKPKTWEVPSWWSKDFADPAYADKPNYALEIHWLVRTLQTSLDGHIEQG